MVEPLAEEARIAGFVPESRGDHGPRMRCGSPCQAHCHREPRDRRLEPFGDYGLIMSVLVPLGNRWRSAYSEVEAGAQLAALESRRERH